MTRRIVAAILLAVWTTLVVGGIAAFWIVRSVMLDDLDASIALRVSALIESSLTQPAPHGKPHHPRDRFFIADENGQTIARMSAITTSPHAPEIVSRAFTTTGDGQRMRTLTLRSDASAEPSGHSGKIQVVYSAPADAFDRTLTRLSWTLFLGGLTAGLFAAMVATLVARRALAPLRQATEVIRAINVHHLDRRLEPRPLPEELRPVATTLNEMLTLLQNAVEERQQFLADASHELRTPLASLVMALEVSLSRPRSESELRVTLQRCLNSANTLRQIVEQLLDQIRGDHPSGGDPVQGVDVAECLKIACARHAGLAEEKGIRIEQQCNPCLRVMTQPHRLMSIISNLVSNAVTHNRRDGWVNVTVEYHQGQLMVSVSDNGPGIPLEQQARVFEPFYRGSLSHDASEGHVGLGLFLVRSHVHAMGGRYDLKSSTNVGTTIRITLPNCPAVSTHQHEISEVDAAIVG